MLFVWFDDKFGGTFSSYWLLYTRSTYVRVVVTVDNNQVLALYLEVNMASVRYNSFGFSLLSLVIYFGLNYRTFFRIIIIIFLVF